MSGSGNRTTSTQRPRWRFTLRDLILLVAVCGLVLGCTVEFAKNAWNDSRSEFASADNYQNVFAQALSELGIERASEGGGMESRGIVQKGKHSYSLLNQAYDSKIMQKFRELVLARLQDAECHVEFVNQPDPGRLDDELVIAYSTDKIRGLFCASIVEYGKRENRNPLDPETRERYLIRLNLRCDETPK